MQVHPPDEHVSCIWLPPIMYCKQIWTQMQEQATFQHFCAIHRQEEQAEVETFYVRGVSSG